MNLIQKIFLRRTNMQIEASANLIPSTVARKNKAGAKEYYGVITVQQAGHKDHVLEVTGAYDHEDMANRAVQMLVVAICRIFSGDDMRPAPELARINPWPI